MSRLDFTCADATGCSKSMPFRPPPLTASGARESPPRPRMSAPISLSGCITRSMGRESRESSPVSTVKKGWAASSPVTSRAAVPTVAGVQHIRGLDQAAHAAAADLEALVRAADGAVLVLDDLHAEAPHAAEYGRAVVPLAEVRHVRRAVGDRVE